MKRFEDFLPSKLNENEEETFKRPEDIWGELPPVPSQEAWERILTSLAYQYDKDWATTQSIILEVGEIAKGKSSGYGGYHPNNFRPTDGSSKLGKAHSYGKGHTHE